MASVYPGSLDSLATNKADATTMATDHKNHHNDLADAVNKIEAELGTDPSGTDATVKASLEAARRYYPVPSGGDDTAGLESAINALPSTGGEIQLRSLTYSISALTALRAQSNVTIRGVGPNRTQLHITGTTGKAIDMDGASFCTWEDMTIAQVAKRTAGSVFFLDDALGSCQQNSFRRLWMSSSYRGWHMTDTTGIRIEDIQVSDLNDSWGWHSLIHCDGQVTSSSADNLRGGTAAGMSTAFCYLAHALIDTFHGNSWDILNYPIASTITTTNTSTTVTGVTNTAAWRNGMYVDAAGIPANTTVVSGAGTATMVLSAAATASATVPAGGRDGMTGLIVDGGTWGKFTNVSIESGNAEAVTINGGTQTHFINPHLLGLHGAYIHAGTGTKLIGGNVVNSSIDGILIDGGTDTLISGMDIHDVGNGGGGSGWNGIKVAAGVSDFQIVGNTIGRAILGSTTVASGITILAGASNNYRIRGNRSLNYTDGSATGISDLGTGTSKDVGGNAGLLTGGNEIGLKLPVRVAAPVNVTVATPGATVDGVTMVAGDRMLLANQTTASQNGIYRWNGAASAATRTSDADTAAKLTDSLLVTVDEGTVNRDSLFSMSTNKPITLGSTSLRFTRVHPSYQVSSHPSNTAFLPANSKLENLDRTQIALANQALLASGTVRIFPMGILRAGDTLATINFRVGTTASATITNSWAGIARLSDRVVLAVSATSTATTAAQGLKTFTFGSAFTADKDETLVGFVMYQATTPPSLHGINHGDASIVAEAPVANGTSNTGATTPVAAGATLTAFTADTEQPYAYCT